MGEKGEAERHLLLKIEPVVLKQPVIDGDLRPDLGNLAVETTEDRPGAPHRVAEHCVAVVLEESGQGTEPAVALLGGRAAGLQIARDKEDRSSDPGEIF